MFGCNEKSSQPVAAAASERVVAVAAKAPTEPPTTQFCERYTPAAGAQPFQYPAVTPAAGPVPARLQWINVWATWCRPCIEELPMLVGWSRQLAAEDTEVDFVFLSVDESDDAVNAYRAAHPETPTGPRVLDQASGPAFLTSVGLDPGATIPIHILVDARGRTRCVRTGAVSVDDYPVAKAVLASL